LAIAGAPTPYTVIAGAAGVDAGAFQTPLGPLRAAQLVRVTRRGDERLVEPYHDRVRESILPHRADTGESGRASDPLRPGPAPPTPRRRAGRSTRRAPGFWTRPIAPSSTSPGSSSRRTAATSTRRSARGESAWASWAWRRRRGSRPSPSSRATSRRGAGRRGD